MNDQQFADIEANLAGWNATEPNYRRPVAFVWACEFAIDVEVLLAEVARLRAGVAGIGTARCLSDGPCAPHGHPACLGGSCVTCQARTLIGQEVTA